MPIRLLGPCALVSLLAACSGGDDDGDGGHDFDAPACAPGEVAIEGTVDGAEESARLTGASGYVFVNALNGWLGTLNVTFGAEDMLHLEWPDLVANGDSVVARGTIALAGLSYGNCEDDDFPGTLRMDADGNGGAFRLSSLHPGADCASSEVSGELTGCFASSNP